MVFKFSADIFIINNSHGYYQQKQAKKKMIPINRAQIAVELSGSQVEHVKNDST